MRFIEVKSILNRKKIRDSWFLDDYTLNPFSGCPFNCQYCYIRGSKYGEHLEEKLAIKKNAPELLDRQLSLKAKKRQHGIIVLSSATDPYLPFEECLKLTRTLLEIIFKHRFPLHIITKSDQVPRDFDILKEIDRVAILPADLSGRLDHKVFITFSFSTTDDGISKIFEPGATPPVKRLEVLRKTSDENFATGVSMMPLLPFISDTEDTMRMMLEKFKDAGAKYVLPASLTLFGTGSTSSMALTLRSVDRHYPELSNKYRELFHNPSKLKHHHHSVHRKAHELLKELGLKGELFKSK